METIYLLLADAQTIDVMLKDGGMASIYHNGERFITNYYQTRFTEEELRHYEKWDMAQQDSKMYVKEWDENIKFITQAMINDSAEWLEMGLDTSYTQIVFLEDRHDMADILEIEEAKFKSLNLDFEEQFHTEYSKVEEEIEELYKKYAEGQSQAEDVDTFRQIGEKFSQLRIMEKEYHGWKMIMGKY